MKKIRPGQKIKLTSVEELLGVSNEESAMDIEVVKIQPFRNHPFKVIDDEKMEDLFEVSAQTAFSLPSSSVRLGTTSMRWSPATVGCTQLYFSEWTVFRLLSEK